MRIGFDVAQSCTDRAGCGWYADALVRALAQVAPEHTYVLYHHFDRWHNADTRHGTYWEAANVEHPFYQMTAAESAHNWDEIRRTGTLPGKPNIVHTTSFQAPKLSGTKLIFTVFDTSFWAVPQFTTEANRLRCQEGVLEALRHADGFAFISQSARDEFELVLPGWLEENQRPWAVTPLAHKETTPSFALPSSTTDAYWLSVGSLEPRKNYETLLDALEIYWSRSARRIPLRIAGGKGWKSEALRQRISSLEQRGLIKYLGYVPDSDLVTLYARAYGFVFPSWYEGFGLPVIEAMAHGCPVISSDRTSLREVGGDAAVYIDPSDAAGIAQSMLTLENDVASRTALVIASRAQAARFSWAETARRTLELYARALAG